MTGPLLLTAWLDSPLAGEPPQLDALLEWTQAPFEPGFRGRQANGEPHQQLDRSRPAPAQGVIPIPLARTWKGPWLIAHCSSPILPKPVGETVEHVNKRVAVEHAGLLAVAERKIVTTTNDWTKSYRLPLRVRAISCVRWFCLANERNLKKALRYAKAIGKKVSDGYGRVQKWTTEPVEQDCSWFARSEAGSVLMRPLPLYLDGMPWLPKDLVGYRRYFGACSPPYWHPERFGDVVIPC